MKRVDLPGRGALAACALSLLLAPGAGALPTTSVTVTIACAPPAATT